VNKAQTFVMVLAAALVAAVCSALGAEPANAARDYHASSSYTPLLQPSDDGEPVGTSADPLETGESVQIIVRGLGSVQGSGFNCGRTCSLSFKRGQRIVISAQEANGYRFSGWERACGAAPQSHSCGFKAGDVHLVYAVFVPLIPVSVLRVTPTFGVKDNRNMRKIEVQFDVGASAVVTYELRQNAIVLQSWKSSPFTGSSTRSVWIDDRFSAGAYELGLRVATGTQVRSFRATVVLPPPQP